MLNIRKFAYKLQACALILFSEKGGNTMMAMLWAQQIMLGKKTFDQVPRLLKAKVKEILIDSGMEELVTEE